jgi:hypothetical protein
VKQVDKPRGHIVRCNCEHSADEDGPTSAPYEGWHSRYKCARRDEDALVLTLSTVALLHSYGGKINSGAVISVSTLSLIVAEC